MNLFVKFLAGIMIGIANVIPGVSGGTIAVIFNVYPELLTLTSLDFKKIFPNFKVLLSICLGIATGILIFAKTITFAYEKFPIYTNFFFVGIVLGSIPFLFNMIKSSETKSKKTSLTIKIIVCFLNLALMIGLFIAKLKFGNTQNNIIELDILQALILFFVGIIGAIAMLIPGISGSFLILILGYYKTVISAISSFNIPVLICFGAGVLLGLVTSARILIRVLEKHGSIIYSAILGLVLGSILQILPLVKQTPTGFFISAIFAIGGAVLILLFTLIS